MHLVVVRGEGVQYTVVGVGLQVLQGKRGGFGVREGRGEVRIGEVSGGVPVQAEHPQVNVVDQHWHRERRPEPGDDRGGSEQRPPGVCGQIPAQHRCSAVSDVDGGSLVEQQLQFVGHTCCSITTAREVDHAGGALQHQRGP